MITAKDIISLCEALDNLIGKKVINKADKSEWIISEKIGQKLKLLSVETYKNQQGEEKPKYSTVILKTDLQNKYDIEGQDPRSQEDAIFNKYIVDLRKKISPFFSPSTKKGAFATIDDVMADGWNDAVEDRLLSLPILTYPEKTDDAKMYIEITIDRLKRELGDK